MKFCTAWLFHEIYEFWQFFEVWTIFSYEKVHIFEFFEIFVSHIRKHVGLFEAQNFYIKLSKSKRRMYVYEEKGTNLNTNLEKKSIFVPISLFSSIEKPNSYV